MPASFFQLVIPLLLKAVLQAVGEVRGAPQVQALTSVWFELQFYLGALSNQTVSVGSQVSAGCL